MAYTPKTWVTGETIEATELNHMEQGIAEADAAATGTGTIGTQQLADGAVTTEKIATGAVYTEKLADDAVTYDKIAQNAVDSVNIRNGAVTAAKLGADVITELDSKAYIDGSYEGMTVGNAEQLVSSVGIEDSTPYNFRTSGGSVDIGDREELNAVVGATVVWNQLFKSDTTITFAGLTTTTPKTGTWRFNGTLSAAASGDVGNPTLLANHVYMMDNGRTDTKIVLSNTQTWTIEKSKYVFKVGAANKSVNIYMSAGTYTDDDFTPQVFDLTQKLGSTIADYIYALEQSNAGAGVAWFRKYFSKPLYAYNPGELLSVRTNLHRMVGFNAFDKSKAVADQRWESNSTPTASGYTRSDYIRVVGGATYYFKDVCGYNNWTAVYWFDSNKNYISSDYKTGASPQSFTATAPDNAVYCGINIPSAYVDSCCVNLHWDGERDGEYAPYEAHEYALDDITLRGTLKLDASNNLYADGDRYLPDGTVERRYGVVDLGTLTWRGSDGGFSTVADASLNLKVDVKNAVCGKYRFNGNANGTSATAILNALADKEMASYSSEPQANRFVVKDSAYTDAAAFKTAMSGVYLVYELATPTTENASPYQQTQIVDDFGTEEFVDAAVEAGERDVAIMVGNETVYKPNLRAKLEMAPDSPDGDGDYIVRQTNGQNSYIPLVEVKELPDMPSTDGSYKLHCTVANGTATLSWVSDS